jgi:hypothetical protein
MTIDDRLDAAADLAEKLTHAAPHQSPSLDPIWDASAEALEQLADAGYAPEEFLPEGVAGELNFKASDAHAVRRFYRAYALEVRNAVCGKGEELRGLINNAIAAGATSILTVLAAALSIPLGAVALLAPIAAVLLIKGIEAFCVLGPAQNTSEANDG